MDIVASAYDKAELSDGPDGEAQRVNDTPGLAELLGAYIAEHRAANLFESEEVVSNYQYPPEYKGPRPIEEQIAKIAEVFGLDGASALAYAKQLPDFKSFVPKDALPWVGWFAVIAESGLVKLFPDIATNGNEQAVRYCLGTNLTYEKIAATRPFHNWRTGQIVPERHRLTERTLTAHREIASVQRGDIWLIAAQLGMWHRGRSVRRSRAVFAQNEFGLGSVMGGSIALTHPERFVRFEELDTDLPGDEFDDPGADVRFDRAPLLVWRDGGLEFTARWFDRAHGGYGSASAFLPQVNLGS